jgi:hypothetical protein
MACAALSFHEVASGRRRIRVERVAGFGNAREALLRCRDAGGLLYPQSACVGTSTRSLSDVDFLFDPWADALDLLASQDDPGFSGTAQTWSWREVNLVYSILTTYRCQTEWFQVFLWPDISLDL